jgi:hypothetical protein
MDTDNIKTKYDKLNAELKQALSSMTLSDRIFTIRDEIKDLQKICPHSNGLYDFSHSDECPYCGKKFGK